MELLIESGYPSLDLYKSLKLNFGETISYDYYLTHPYFKHLYIRDGNKIIANLLYSLENGHVHINYIFVDVDFRGRGISKKLMSHLIDFSKKTMCYKITSHVREDNESSVNLHKSMGFKRSKGTEGLKYKDGARKIRFLMKF